MFNTYINDNVTNPYPFFGVDKLPFPMGCIAGMGLCVKGDRAASAIYASSVVITSTHVHVVICRGTSPLITLTATINVSDKSATEYITTDDAKVTGYLILGSLDGVQPGAYAGRFYIDPSCILFMPDSVFSSHSYIKINNQTYNLGKSLSITAKGLLHFNSSQEIAGTSESAGLVLAASDVRDTYDMVTSVNGMTSPDGSFSIGSGTPDTIRLAVADSGEDSGIIRVVVDGTKNFPNCYKSEEDGALGI